VAVIDPVVSALMVPMVALKLAVEPPADSVTLAGMVIRLLLVLSETVVLAVGGCETVTVHALAAPDIKPIGLQLTDVTCSAATREIVTDCEDVL